MSQPFDYPGPDPDREDLGSSRYTKKEVLFAGGDAEPDNGIYMYHVDNGFRRVGGTDLVSIDEDHCARKLHATRLQLQGVVIFSSRYMGYAYQLKVFHLQLATIKNNQAVKAIVYLCSLAKGLSKVEILEVKDKRLKKCSQFDRKHMYLYFTSHVLLNSIFEFTIY